MTTTTRPPQLPRGAAVLDPAVTEAILAAGLDELSTRGYAAMSMDGVARRAGVGKSAIYRRWPSKEQLTGEVITRLGVRSVADLPDTGSLRGDIRVILDELSGWFGDARTGPAFTELVAESARNPVLADLLLAQFSLPRRRRVDALLDRAVERGELSEHADRALLLDLVAALPYWRIAITHRDADASFLDRIAELVTSEAIAAPTVPTSADHDEATR